MHEGYQMQGIVEMDTIKWGEEEGTLPEKRFLSPSTVSDHKTINES